MLKAIGFWMGGLSDEALPAPQEIVGFMPSHQRTRLADYLAAGMTYERWMGYAYCRFLCGAPAPSMGSRDLTDGTWFWPEGLAHYVREHGILLPEEFVRDALSKSTPIIPGWIKEELTSVTQYIDSLDYWRSWSASRRSQGILDRIRAGRVTAEALAAADVATRRSDEIAALIAKRGEGDARCLWRGCPHKALVGLYVCAAHSFEVPDDPKGRLSEELKKILMELTARVSQPSDS